MGSGWHKFDHVGILVKDLDKAMDLYKKLFDFDLPKTGPYNKIIKSKEHRYCLLSAKGEGEEEIFIEFFDTAHDAESRRVLDLSRADGVIAEICIAVDNIEEWYDKVKRTGYTPVTGPSGRPLTNEKYVLSPAGSKYFYLLPSETGQQYFIEILERPGDPYRKH